MDFALFLFFSSALTLFLLVFLQAHRKADTLHLSLSALGDKVKQQTCPNKDVQKEIADMTEVGGVSALQSRSLRFRFNDSVLPVVHRHGPDLSVAEGRDEGDAEGSEEDHGRSGPQLQGRHPEESPGEDEGGDREQAQPAAAHHGNGNWSLSEGKRLDLITHRVHKILKIT